jgi:hypothetical protein
LVAPGGAAKAEKNRDDEERPPYHGNKALAFLVWTGAARAQDVVADNPGAGARSRTFFTWVRDSRDEPGDNIYVRDFFGLETEGRGDATSVTGQP